ncbi:tripartite tricarboxylate transporter substrate-binding protein [Arthrobacter sp. CAN_C5]|uniref:Bug family tripartite tricarboxylate transporter substrate binding protein n=1 Tax=Arthrobacter sp. CAN_C5 TaxID=2760706 RepID=UPI0028ABB51F|nr:tripartite tricarboxylate transporter substrate-binding protein [Arthrobacter sp. CAN_C5]MBP2218413.1 putative tricarboxylic transport membrane protein [Arthrobacter sp. CAN_C5]
MKLGAVAEDEHAAHPPPVHHGPVSLREQHPLTDQHGGLNGTFGIEHPRKALSACGDSGAETPEGGIDRLNIVVPADPGGGWDQTGRAIQTDLEENDLVGSASVENVGGAGGTNGLTRLATEQDPNTLMVMGYVMVGAVETNAAETRIEDTTPIARLTDEPLVVVVPAESPYQTIEDLVADIEENGQAVSVTGGSAGGADHILAGMILEAEGVAPDKLNYIPYSGGGESLAALLGNQVSAGISGVGEYAEQVKAGTVRALAVSGEEPAGQIPEVETLTDQGIDVVLTNWRGVVAPGSIDEEQAAALTDLITELHETESWQETLTENNWRTPSSPARSSPPSSKRTSKRSRRP